jgi:hypothetical protein
LKRFTLPVHGGSRKWTCHLGFLFARHLEGSYITLQWMVHGPGHILMSRLLLYVPGRVDMEAMFGAFAGELASHQVLLGGCVRKDDLVC